jgi:hypothetical protein
MMAIGLFAVSCKNTQVRGSGHIIRLNAIVGNGSAGLNVIDASSITLRYNNIYGNSTYEGPNCGLTNGSAELSAPNNFWGAASGPGDDPADNVCGDSLQTFEPFAKKEFQIP